MRSGLILQDKIQDIPGRYGDERKSEVNNGQELRKRTIPGRYGRKDAKSIPGRYGKKDAILIPGRYGRKDTILIPGRYGRKDSNPEEKDEILIPGRYGRKDSNLKKKDEILIPGRYGRKDEVSIPGRYGDELIPGRYGDNTMLSGKIVPRVPWGRWAGRDIAAKDNTLKNTASEKVELGKDDEEEIPGRYGDELFSAVVEKYGRIPGRYGDETDEVSDIPGRYSDSKSNPESSDNVKKQFGSARYRVFRSRHMGRRDKNKV